MKKLHLKSPSLTLRRLILVSALILAISPRVNAADKNSGSAAGSSSGGAPAASDADTSGAEEVKVEQIKHKYWAGGDDSEVGVVQNRAYSKAHKWELGVGGGVSFSDPFLSNKMLSATVGYNFSEYFAVEAMYWKYYSSGSSADAALEASGKSANTNPPGSYYGAEAVWSIMYGKLSVVGHKIIYYDFYLTGGGGVTNTESGNDLTGTAGLGQRFFVSQTTSIRADYRFTIYRENIIEKQIPELLGQSDGYRNNLGQTIMISVDFLFGGGGKK